MTPRRVFGCSNSTRCDTKIHAVMVDPGALNAAIGGELPCDVVQQEEFSGRIHHHRYESRDQASERPMANRPGYNASGRPGHVVHLFAPMETVMKRVDPRVVAERQSRDDEMYRLRVRVADLEDEVAKMTTRVQRAEAQSAAFRASVEGMAALIANVGLATGK